MEKYDEMAERLWNRAKARFRDDWGIGTEDQRIVIRDVAAELRKQGQRIEKLEAALRDIVEDANRNEGEAEEMGWSGIEILRSNIKQARAVLKDDDEE